MSPLNLLAQLPLSLLNGVRTILVKLTSPSTTPLLPWVPKSVKIIVFLIFLIHSPSWPFQWHIRVWYWGIKEYYLAYRKGRAKYLKDWKKDSDRRGGIKGLRLRHKRLAWLDDCDYNIHLSNSAYAKNSDVLKMDWYMQALSPFFTPGSHMAMGATHYNFFKEIPIGATYTMEARCGGWDDKWIYVLTEFVIYPKKGGKGRARTIKDTASEAKDKIIDSTSQLNGTPPVVPVISAPPTRTATPDLSLPPSASGSGANTPASASQGSVTGAEAVKRAWAKKREEQPREDGGVVCCLTISEYCFKMGRITVPPRIALWLSLHSPKKDQQDRARAILMGKDGGKAFLRGGWKDEPNAESLGADIGLEEGEAREGSWVERGSQGMIQVAEGMSVF
ncbi:hypothetical protein CI109_105636 [Kwoniella shandongensis]|uniref:Uncharacterized protein n=1 Tax=Kwoniella shandongensis TaxID=1734106 RepID=A0A5M6C2S7_9TREE|nr:uncharacterized protein CI109_002352 [Kwoniella shandongensis]KAA5529457.1 hypothetical protein CI109_002352 [Kwoniella shandongensis]